MSPELGVWVACLALAILALHYIPTWWKSRRNVREPSTDLRIVSNALMDWLQQPKIVQSVVESGSYTRKQLQYEFEMIPWMSEFQLRQAAQKLLADRLTRRVVATYMERAHGTDRREVMKALLSWAGVAA